MSKHTPGPWKVWHEFGLFLWVVEDKGRKREGDNPRICGINYDDMLEDSEAAGTWREANSKGKANARLIAAAPDLLESLQWAVDNPEDAAYWLTRARHAIAKATGETK
jgi:hypothetical protein